MSGAAVTGGGGDVGGEPAGAGEPSGTPQAQRTPQQASDLLDARIAIKRAQAESGDEGRSPQGQVKPSQLPVRGPDGKFLPTSRSTSTQSADVASPDESARDGVDLESHPEHKRLREAHDSLQERDGEWTKIAERALARMDSQKAYIAQLEQALQERGGSVDPTKIENVRLQERIRAIELAEERAAAAAEQEQRASVEAERVAAREHLTSTTKAALAQYPQLLRSGPELKEFLTAVYRGGDVETLAEFWAGRADKRYPSENRPMAPRTLAGRGSGGGGPRLTDPRDIADKWKKSLGLNA